MSKTCPHSREVSWRVPSKVFHDSGLNFWIGEHLLSLLKSVISLPSGESFLSIGNIGTQLLVNPAADGGSGFRAPSSTYLWMRGCSFSGCLAGTSIGGGTERSGALTPNLIACMRTLLAPIACQAPIRFLTCTKGTPIVALLLVIIASPTDLGFAGASCGP